jgi:hypothetical protein
MIIHNKTPDVDALAYLFSVGCFCVYTFIFSLTAGAKVSSARVWRLVRAHQQFWKALLLQLQD